MSSSPRACVRVCVRACVCACVRVSVRVYSYDLGAFHTRSPLDMNLTFPLTTLGSHSRNKEEQCMGIIGEGVQGITGLRGEMC